jgi:hypothetical protein
MNDAGAAGAGDDSNSAMIRLFAGGVLDGAGLGAGVLGAGALGAGVPNDEVPAPPDGSGVGMLSKRGPSGCFGLGTSTVRPASSSSATL